MYIIDNGKAYSIKGDKAYELIVNINGDLSINKEKFIEVKGKQYTYEEVYRKLNIAYIIENTKKEIVKRENESEEIKSLKQTIKDLQDEIDSLKSKDVVTKDDEQSNEEHEEEIKEEVSVEPKTKKNK